MKTLKIALLMISPAVSLCAETPDPLSLKLSEESVAVSIQNIAEVYDLSVVIPDSALDKRVSVSVNKKDPIEILKAIALASGYEVIEENGIFILKDVSAGCACQAGKQS